jgi:hypothetical protein
MVQMSFRSASVVVAAILTTVPSTTAELSKTGNITLFSDTSCEEPVYVNSFILGPDACGAADNSASSPSDVVFQSYTLNERPWCTNGSRPYFNVYSDTACTSLIQSNAPGPLYSPSGPDAEYSCVAPGNDHRYQAMAFICDGFPGAWGPEGSESPVSSTGGETVHMSSTSSAVPTLSSTVSSSATTVTSVSPTHSAASESSSTTTSLISNASTVVSDTPSALPNSTFDGAGSLPRGSRSRAVALFLPILGLLA